MTSEPSGARNRRLLVRDDGAHVADEAVFDLLAELTEAPSRSLGLTDRAMLEKLGELDDVVFEAIAGRAAAVERLRTLWPEALTMVGLDLIDESRGAYLKHALVKWQECAGPDDTRNPRLAVTLMDVLAILVDGK